MSLSFGVEIQEIIANLLSDLQTLQQKNTASMRAVRRKYSQIISAFTARQVFALADQIIKITNLRWIAYELVASHPEAYNSITADELELLGEGMTGWDEVDAFARTLSGPVWRDGQIGDQTVIAWASSPNRWWRRAALVSTVALNMRSQGG